MATLINLVDSRGNIVEIPESKTAQGKFDLSKYSLAVDGEIICKNLKPLYLGLTFEDYVYDMDYIEAMSATEYTGDKLKKYMELFILAEKKHDGHRAIMKLLFKETNRLFSKRISKTSGWFTENTDTVPHIRDIPIPEEFKGTILDGEITSEIEGADSNTVQTVTGSLPVKALYNQLNNVGLLIYNIFDIIQYKNVNVSALPLYMRKLFAFKVFKAINSPYVTFSKMYIKSSNYDKLIKLLKDNAYMLSKPELEDLLSNYIEPIKDYPELFEEFVGNGFEGIMLKLVFGDYKFKKEDLFVKMKETRTFDVIVMRAGDTRKEYTGKSKSWYLFEDKKGNKIQKVMNIEQARKFYGYEPISKPYFNGWVQTLICGVYNEKGKLVEIAEVSSFTDLMAQYITEHLDELLGEPIEIKGQRVMDKSKGTIRHPRFGKLRPDQEPKNCTMAKVLE